MTKLCWVHTGDSLSAGVTTWPWRYLNVTSKGDAGNIILQASYTYISGNILFRNMALSSTGLYGDQTTNDVTLIAPTYVDPIPVVKSIPGITARKYLFTTAIGTNDQAIGHDASATAYAASVATMAAARRSAGFDLVGLCTLLPSARLAYNGCLTDASWRLSHSVDYVIDLAAETTVGNPANITNTTWYVDQLHYTDASCTLLVDNIVTPAMTAILGAI
jgi:hypothetical protein